MKIAILTMHRVINYGSALQAYGLKKILESYGHQCKFIDIIPGNRIGSEQTKCQVYSEKFRNIFGIGPYAYLKSRIFNFDRKKCIDAFLKAHLDVTAIDYDVADCDAVVVGSDEVFNVLQDSPWGLSHQLIGDIDCNLKISYAASFGHTSLSKIALYNVRDEISNQLCKFNNISVRDDNSLEIVKELIGVVPSVNLDPVLIYPFTSEIQETQNFGSDYLIVYGYNNRINDAKTIKAVREFAKQNRLLTISTGNYQSWCDKQIACSPFEILGLFRDAKFVLSDTFHGTVLAIKYRKKFASIVRESNRQKMTDLLQRFELQDHICDKAEDIVVKFQMELNDMNISKCIQTGVEQTNVYFHKNGL